MYLCRPGSSQLLQVKPAVMFYNANVLALPSAAGFQAAEFFSQHVMEVPCVVILCCCQCFCREKAALLICLDLAAADALGDR